MSDADTDSTLRGRMRAARLRVYWAEQDAERAKESKAKADEAVASLIDAMVAAGQRAIFDQSTGDQVVRMETRRDITITNVDDVVAALMERGADVPMKVDTVELRKIAKAVGDLPGIAPTETRYLKWSGTE